MTMRAVIFTTAIAAMLMAAPAAPAASMRPDDSSVSANLQGWYLNVAENYDPSTETWQDTSGNDRDLSDAAGAGVGNSTLGTTTFTPTGGLFKNRSLNAVDLGTDPREVIGTGDNVVSDKGPVTIVGLYRPETPGDNSNRPLGIGTEDPRTNQRSNFHLANDGSIRHDDGGTGGNSNVPSRAFIWGVTSSAGDGSEDQTAASQATINSWFFDGESSTFSDNKSVQHNGEPFAGLNGLNAQPFGIGELMHRSDDDIQADVVQAAVYNTELTETQVTDIAEWMATNPNAIPEPATLALLAPAGLLALRRRR